MISRETEALLQRLLVEQPTYKPSQNVLDRVQQITMISFVGASSMGKTTLMQLLARTAPGYGITKNFTSRSPRPEDDPGRYVYFEHTDAGLKPILDRIASHELLQYNIHPFSLHVYGSEIEGYPHHYNMGDIFYSSIDGFRQLGFKKLYVFSVITEPATWQARFDKRFPAGHSQRQARLAEAVSSLKWSLAQDNPDHAWIIDRDNECEAAASDVQAVIGGAVTQQNEAHALAIACLELIEMLQA